MGEPGFEPATATALPVFNPKAAASQQADDLQVVTLISIIKIVQPVTVTEVVAEAAETATAEVVNPLPAPTLASERVFPGLSSSALIRVLGATTLASPPPETASLSSASIVEAIPPHSSSSERVFALPTQSRPPNLSPCLPGAAGASSRARTDRSVSVQRSGTSTPPSTERVAGSFSFSDPSLISTGSSARISTTTSIPLQPSRSSSVFAHIGDSPANIALTTFVCAAILASLLAIPLCLFRRRQRRRRRAQLGQHALGSEGGSPPNGAGWSPVTPAARWSQASEERSPPAELGDMVRDMRELWRESALSEVGAAGPATGTHSPASSWTSFVGGYPSTDGHGNVGLFADPFRRTSETTVGTAILDWSARRPSAPFAAAHVRAPHPLRMSMRPDDISPSLYSGSHGAPVSPRSPYPAPGLASPFIQRSEPEPPRVQPNFRLRPKPSWRESLDRVMRSAADLVGSSAVTSRRGSVALSFRSLRHVLARRDRDEEQGEKAPPRSETEDDEKRVDYFDYAFPRAGSSVSSCLLSPDRPLTPSSPLLGYAPATGAMGLLIPPRPAHIRAASSGSFYGPSGPPPTPPPFALPPAASTAARFPPSPEVPPFTPPARSPAQFAAMQPSPAPFSRLEAALDPFADPSPCLTPALDGSGSRASLHVPQEQEEGEEEEETLSQLAHHAAFAQLHLLRRVEGRRASSRPSSFARTDEAAEEASEDGESLDLSSSSSSHPDAALEPSEERLARRGERETAAALMRERRRRSLLALGRQRGSVIGSLRGE
ncbi:hypothetical protein JCM10450v2_002584 [Rhodotorula kratochvilovae]